jgi:hypothetical protein
MYLVTPLPTVSMAASGIFKRGNMNDWRTILEREGWAILDCSKKDSLGDFVSGISENLGVPVPGRKGNMLERLQPVSDESAHPQSLSKKYGLGAFPLHSDTAHWPVPCRYIVLGCEEPGQVLSPTVLLDTDRLDLSEAEASCIKTAAFFVKNGGKSFYSSIRSKDRPFFRFDPGCMYPVSVDGEKAMKAMLSERHVGMMVEIPWQKNRVAVIDNWRMLHGRDNSRR